MLTGRRNVDTVQVNLARPHPQRTIVFDRRIAGKLPGHCRLCGQQHRQRQHTGNQYAAEVPYVPEERTARTFTPSSYPHSDQASHAIREKEVHGHGSRTDVSSSVADRAGCWLTVEPDPDNTLFARKFRLIRMSCQEVIVINPD